MKKYFFGIVALLLVVWLIYSNIVGTAAVFKVSTKIINESITIIINTCKSEGLYDCILGVLASSILILYHVFILLMIVVILIALCSYLISKIKKVFTDRA